MRFIHCVALSLLISGPIAVAQEPAPEDQSEVTPADDTPAVEIPGSETEQGESQPQATALPNRWLLLCCGLPGDDGHRERLTGACEKIITAAEPILGVSPDRLRVLMGDQEMSDAIADQAQSVGVCTKESVAEVIHDLCDVVQAGDSCWVIMLGHAHFYDGASQFNVLGPDIDQSEFAAWAKPLACSEQVFWITMPVSGFWIKPISGASRVVISATEPDLEVTGTEMPYVLADLFSGDQEQQALEDIDQDGSLTLLDLYLAANLEIHGRFTSIERLQTEHAQLEDNGDGRGSEVQLAYLPVDEDEESDESTDETESPEESSDETQASRQRPEPISNQNLDGFRSRHILIRSPSN